MQIEVYKMTVDGDHLTISLEAICDSFSSLLWDSDWRKLKWHITTDGKNANDVSGKKLRERFYGNAVLTRILSKKSVSMTGRILMQPDGFTAI